MKDAKEHLFDTYLATMKRGRWLLLTITLLSCLMLVNTYLESFGFEKEQLEGLYANRAWKHTPEFASIVNDTIPDIIKCLDEVQPGAIKDSLVALLGKYSKKAYTKQLTDNTLRLTSVKPQQLPLIGIYVPNNDYPIVIAFMLTVFCIVLWLNGRSMHSAIEDMQEHFGSDPDLPVLVRIQFTFTGMKTSEAFFTGRNFLGRLVEYLAYWLPTISIAVGLIPIVRNLLETRRDPQYYYGGSAVDAVIVVMSTCIVVTLITAIRATKMAHDMDRQTLEWELQAAGRRVMQL